MDFNLQNILDSTSQGTIHIPTGAYDIGHVTIHRPVKLVGEGFSNSILRGSIHSTTRGQTIFEDFRLTGTTTASPHGLQFNYAFRSVVRNCLIDKFRIPIFVSAGNAYTIEQNYLVGDDFGIMLLNGENADEGDGRVVGNTFDSSQGVAAIHYISGGGLRVLDNKILSHQYGILCQFDGVTSDLLISNNSIENQKQVAIAMRVQAGSFENVTVVGNQFAGDMYGITVNGVHRGVCTSNVYNLTKPFFQHANARDWVVANNSPR